MINHQVDFPFVEEPKKEQDQHYNGNLNVTEEAVLRHNLLTYMLHSFKILNYSRRVSIDQLPKLPNVRVPPPSDYVSM